MKAVSSNPRWNKRFMGNELSLEQNEKCKDTLFWNSMVAVLKKKSFAGFRKHVIPTTDGAAAWDLCFLKPSYKVLTS